MSDINRNVIEMECFYERKINENKTWRKKIEKFLESHLFHKLVVLFVVIACLCFSLEFTLDSIEKIFITNHEIKLNELNQTLIQHDSHGHHHGSNVTDHNHHSSKHDNHQAHLIFHVLEMIFKYTSITILGMFVVEFIVKLIFTPRVFIKVWEILDALVVVISFGLNNIFD